MKLTATKSFLYNNRRLLPGDDFETKKDVHGTLLIAAKKAREVRSPGKLEAPPAAVKAKASKAKVEAPAEEDLSALRAEYQEKVGKRPFHGWDAETLHAKMTKNEPVDVDDAPAEEEIEADDATS